MKSEAQSDPEMTAQGWGRILPEGKGPPINLPVGPVRVAMKPGSRSIQAGFPGWGTSLYACGRTIYRASVGSRCEPALTTVRSNS